MLYSKVRSHIKRQPSQRLVDQIKAVAIENAPEKRHVPLVAERSSILRRKCGLGKIEQRTSISCRIVPCGDNAVPPA